jgi:hypothetical protein
MKAVNRPLGEHSVAQSSIQIASFLGLENPEEYTSHSYRHSGATLIADNDGSVMQLKNAGGWQSDKVAQGYVQKSTKTKKRAAELIGLFGQKSEPTVEKVKMVKENTEELTKTSNSSGVTNIFNFTGDATSIQMGDFTFGADRNARSINFNKAYGSYTNAAGESEIIQLPEDYNKPKSADK